jgi:hypothetical protein
MLPTVTEAVLLPMFLGVVSQADKTANSSSQFFSYIDCVLIVLSGFHVRS